MFGVDNDRRILSGDGVSMAIQATPRNVENPIFDDAGAGIKGRLHGQVKIEGGIGDFDYEMYVLWLRIGGNKRGTFAVEDDDVGFGLVAGIVARGDVDRGFGVDELLAKGFRKPKKHEHRGIHVGPVFSHFADEFSVDQFEPLLLEETGCFEGGALLAGPALARWQQWGRNFRGGGEKRGHPAIY